MSFILQQTLIYMIPLMIVALAGAFSEHSGIINLALEGEMIIGALTGAIFCKLMIEYHIFSQTSQVLFLLGMLVGAFFGFLFSLLLSWAAIRFKADQTIIGTALNQLAPAIVCTIGLLLFQQERIDSTASFVITSSRYSESFGKLVSQNGFLGFFFDKIYISTYIVIVLFILLSIWLYKSKTGTHLRACGEHPSAADSVGINVYRMRYLGTSISGALAGLGGFIYIVTTAGGSANSGVGGMGFLALAIMIFGNWNPLFIALGSFLFGFLTCLGVISNTIPFLKQLGLPLYFYNMLPYLIVIIVLILTHNKSGCPKAEGIPYDKGQR